MENNSENKARFFALYLFQDAVIIGNGIEGLHDEKFKQAGRYKIDTEALDSLYRIGDCGDAVELTPLLAVTDEDAIEVAKFIGFDKGINQKAYIKVGNHVCKNILDGRMHMMNPIHAFNMLDYLRSKGYALPWMNVSVDQQIEYGWIKLKNE